MAGAATEDRKDEKKATPGYRDRPWIPRFWDGMTAPAWFSLLWRNRFAVHPTRVPMMLIISLCTLANSVLGLLQTALFGRKIARTTIDEDPIFIIGHWRSGTTMLHELLMLDPRHTYPTNYQCFVPNHFLVSSSWLAPMLSVLLPSRRPMDNVAFGWDRPQEDEFALCNIGLPSPYLTLAFPNRPPQDQDYFDFERVPLAAIERWKQQFLWFLKTITSRASKRIVLKSPPHTCRIKTLLEMFPRARFVHIVRDPYVLFPSTMGLWKRLYTDEGLQVPTGAGLEEHVLQTFTRMYAAFDRDRGLLGPGQYCEVRYEELVQDTVGQMRLVYERLGLGQFDEVLPALEDYVAGKKDFKTNRYQISPETRAKIAERWREYFERYGYPRE